jgi:hypothetical protein
MYYLLFVKVENDHKQKYADAYQRGGEFNQACHSHQKRNKNT